jgi:Na+-transporting methylmalonyl-CoA/oxaloacetate decarboxylase gamma subunit
VAQAVGIMIAGLGGVFIGMALLYASIRITSLVTDKLVKTEEEK